MKNLIKKLQPYEYSSLEEFFIHEILQPLHVFHKFPYDLDKVGQILNIKQDLKTKEGLMELILEGTIFLEIKYSHFKKTIQEFENELLIYQQLKNVEPNQKWGSFR